MTPEEQAYYDIPSYDGYDASFQAELDRERRAEEDRRRAEQQQQLGGTVGAATGVRAGQALGAQIFGGPEQAAAQAVSSAAPSATPALAATPPYSAVPSLTESGLGFGAGAPQGQAIGSSANGGFINAPVASEPTGFGAGLSNGFGGALGNAGNFFAANSWAGPLAVAGLGAATAYGAHEGYKQGEGKGTLGGLKAGIQGAGALNAVPILGQAAWLGGALGGTFGSKKGGDQIGRDQYRGGLQETGFLDENYRYQAPDGKYYDLGSESLRGAVDDPNAPRGSEVLGMTPDGKSYNINFDELGDSAHEDIGALNGLVGGLLGLDSKQTSDAVGQFVNVGVQSGDTRAVVDDIRSRIDAAYGDQAVDYLTQGITGAWREGKIDAGERDARLAAVAKEYGIDNPDDTRWENVATLNDEERERNDRELGQKPKAQIDVKRGGTAPTRPTKPAPTQATTTDRKAQIDLKRGNKNQELKKKYTSAGPRNSR